MKVIAATLLLFFIDHSSTLAQGQGGMMESGGGGLGGGQTKTKFVILLGPDLKPGEVPFLDAYDMARGHDPNVISLFIPVESISVDQKTPLPTQPGISVHVEYSNPLPGADGPTIIELESKVRSEAIRYGITAVETKLVEAGDKVRIFLRVGLPNGDLFGINIQKFATLAETLDPDNPTIEVFDERPIHAKNGLAMGMGMAGYGGMSGMTMSSEMGGYSNGMGGMGFPGGMDQIESNAPELPTSIGQMGPDDMSSVDLTTLNANVERLAAQFNAATDEVFKAALKDQLLKTIADSFELRQSMQSSEAKLLAKKLALIEEQIKLRERNRETIIQQRLKKMIGGTP